MVLRLYGNGEAIASLEKSGHGLWRGETCEPGCELLLKPHAGGAAAQVQNDGRVARSAEDLVAALAHPALFAMGYDAERALALESALALLNDAFDDVPEQIAVHAARQIMPPQWRGHLDQLATRLSAAREQRIAMVRPDRTIGPHALAPDCYIHPD